jgi:hypothetical protein
VKEIYDDLLFSSSFVLRLLFTRLEAKSDSTAFALMRACQCEICMVVDLFRL